MTISMSCRVACQLLCAAALWVLSFGSALDAVGDDSKTGASRITGWISDLGHDDYEVREAATKGLSTAGLPAVQPLETAVAQDDPEVTIRALRALEAIFRSDDDLANVAAEAALVRVAASTASLAKERAKTMMAGLVQVREQRAIRALEKLGAETAFSDELLNAAPGRGVIFNQRGGLRGRTVLIGEDWKGGDEGLAQLQRIALVYLVYVTPGADVSKAALEQLDRDFPNRVQRRGAAMLGVEGATLDIGCMINNVTDGGPAEEAGLESQDLVLLYDQEGVTQFDQVIERTKTIKPGQVIEVTVLRNGSDIHNIKVKLGKFTLRRDFKRDASR